MARPIDANFVVYCAESEFSEEDATKVRWLISHIPTIDAEPVRHGYWIQNKSVPDYHSCSDCHVTEKMHKVCGFYLLPKYCPDCGAKMDAEVEG